MTPNQRAEDAAREYAINLLNSKAYADADSTAITLEPIKPFIEATYLAGCAFERERALVLVEALEMDESLIGGFMDQLSIDGIAKPDYPTAYRGLLEMLHCFKRARSALAKYRGEV